VDLWKRECSGQSLTASVGEYTPISCTPLPVLTSSCGFPGRDSLSDSNRTPLGFHVLYAEENLTIMKQAVDLGAESLWTKYMEMPPPWVKSRIPRIFRAFPGVFDCK